MYCQWSLNDIIQIIRVWLQKLQWTISMASSLRLGVDAGFQRLLNIANVH